MKTPILLLALFFSVTLVAGDIAHLGHGQASPRKLNEQETDHVRENLIHLFASANFHQMKGGLLDVKSQPEIQTQLAKVKAEQHIELILKEPARIVVENRDLYAKTLWASIRESDGFLYDYILEQPDGDLVFLAKVRGELVVQFAPYILQLIGKK
jgi:hypothetical protein